MGLHRLSSVVIGVPNVAETARYYTDFGLTPVEPEPGEDARVFRTRDGGKQLRLVETPFRRLVQLTIGADDHDDLGRVTAQLARLAMPGGQGLAEQGPDSVTAVEPATGARVVVAIDPRLDQPHVPATPYNGPGRIERRSSSGFRRAG